MARGTILPSLCPIAKKGWAFLTQTWPVWKSGHFPTVGSPCLNLWNFPHHTYLFFSFLSAEENYTSASIVHHGNKHSRCNYKGPNEGISFAGNASVGENQRRCLINQALDSSQSRPHPLPMCQWWGQLLTLPGGPSS